jgi:NADH-quinone oxidoreductase subunit L
VAALLTAFYMARLMAMTFFGSNRTGAKEREHLHEAPWIMTGPLLVLGLLSLAGGWLNLPDFVPEGFGPHHLLEHWLDPVLQAGYAAAGGAPAVPQGQTEITLIVLAIGIAVAGLIWGWRTTRRHEIVPAHDAPAEQGLWSLIYHKYYIDELYDAMIVAPLERFSRLVLWRKVDQGLIDTGSVNGAANLSRALSWLGSRLQTGQVGVYIGFFVAGVLFVIGMVVW